MYLILFRNTKAKVEQLVRKFHLRNMHNFVEYEEETKIWKSTKDPYDEIRGQNIGEIFLKRWRLRSCDPQKVLETHHDAAVCKTAEDIFRESVTVALNYSKMGITKGDVIVLYSNNNVTITPLTMGSYMIGAIINTFETKYEDADMIDYVLQLLDPSLIIYEKVYKSKIVAALERIKLSKLKHMLCIGGTDTQPEDLNVQNSLLRKVSSIEIEQFNCPELGDPAELVGALLLTSGSTGKPKAVALNHTRLLHGMLVWWQDQRSPVLQPNSGSVIFSFSNMRWISQTISMLQSILLDIPRICFSQLPSGAYGRDIVRQHCVTHFFGIPEFYKAILQSVDPTDTKTLESLKVVLLGGEATPDTTIELSKQRAVNCTVWREFGMTELATCIVIDRVVNGGLLVPGIELKILNDNGNALGPCQRGQICLRAPAPFHYLKINKSNTFLPDGFFNTGDYGFVNEQRLLQVITRYNNLIKTKDLAIVPTEIECEVNQLDGVHASSLVSYRPDNVAPTSPYDLGALFIVLKQLEQTSNIDQIKDNIENTINSKLSPKIRDAIQNIYFIEKLPSLPSGKIDQIALRKLAKERLLTN